MRDDELIGGDDMERAAGDVAPPPIAAGEPRPSVTPLRRARVAAWVFAGTALAIVVALAVIGRMQPPWTLERLVLARANDVRETSERGTFERVSPESVSPERSSAGIPERVDAALAREDVSEQMKLAL